MPMKSQMACVARNTDDYLRLVHQLQLFLDLDYCKGCSVGLPFTILKLWLVQNVAYGLVSGAAQWDHVSLVLKALQCLRVSDKVQFKMLVLAYKALNSLGCKRLPPPVSFILSPKVDKGSPVGVAAGICCLVGRDP